MHWVVLKNECSLSYIEKRIIDPRYKLGSKPSYMPHNGAYHNQYTLALKSFMIIITLLIIMYRNRFSKLDDESTQQLKLFVLIPCIIGLFLWIYVTHYIHKN